MKLKSDDLYITNVQCGVDGTMFISHEGELYACGNNQHNKLGLNDASGFIFSGEVREAMIPTRVKNVKQRILSVSLGLDHTACLTESGQVKDHSRGLSNLKADTINFFNNLKADIYCIEIN